MLDRKQVSFALGPVVKNREVFNGLLEYVHFRLAFLHKELERADMTDVVRIQGQIKELRLIQTLDQWAEDGIRNYE